MARRTAARPFSASSTPAARKPAPKSKRKLDPSNAYTYIAPAAPAPESEPEDERPGARRRAGRGSESEDDMAARVRRVAMMIAADEGGAVEDDDDEEVDSDDAWDGEGSDEERWGDVFRDLRKGVKGASVKGKSKGKDKVLKPAKPLMVNLDESDGEDEPATAGPVARAAALEQDDDDEDEDDVEDGDDEEEEEEEGDEEDEDEEEDDDDEDDDDDEAALSDPALPSDLSDDDDDELDDLDAFVDQLASADQAQSAPPTAARKRRVLRAADAPALDGASTLQSDQRLDLSALIASHPSLSSAAALLPPKSSKASSSVLKAGVLPAPLPTTAQARLDREAAYDATRDEAAKWSTLMKRVKEAEHLSFPLQPEGRGGVKSGGEVLNTYAPRAGHESAVAALLAQANLTDAGVAAAEDAALRGQDLSVEEIAARRAELRHQRELMFRAEARAKRVGKIKSKTFRKLARRREAREAEKNGISQHELERLDPAAADEARDEAERARARERATLRHGAKSGRWAREHGGEDVDATRAAREDMLDLKARLSRKIQGAGSGESDDDDESSAGEDDDEDAIKTRAFDQLARLDAAAAPAPGKGLANMAFMKKAEQREMRRVREDEAAFRRELEGGDDSASDGDGADGVVRIGEGRMVFAGPAAGDAPAAPAAPAPAAAARAAASPPPAPVPFGAANPWLDGAARAGPSRKRPTAAVSAEAKAVRSLKKAKRGKPADDDDALELELDLAPAPAAAAAAAGKPGKRARVAAGPADGDGGDDGDAMDDDGARDELMPAGHGAGVAAFTQRELVAEAFAGDNVVADFAAEKQRIVEADAPKVEDTTLAGWGSWGGKGVRARRPNARHLKTTPGVLPTQRADAGRANVIVSERRDKKAAAFLVRDLPYPYTSVAQYEHSLAAPVGAEWNSRAGFQRGTVPRVVKKPGAIIEPVRKLF